MENIGLLALSLVISLVQGTSSYSERIFEEWNTQAFEVV
jgi:hypothetical protein